MVGAVYGEAPWANRYPHLEPVEMMLVAVLGILLAAAAYRSVALLERDVRRVQRTRKVAECATGLHEVTHVLVKRSCCHVLFVYARRSHAEELGDGLGERRRWDVECARRHVPHAAVLEHEEEHEEDVLRGELRALPTSHVPMAGHAVR